MSTQPWTGPPAANAALVSGRSNGPEMVSRPPGFPWPPVLFVATVLAALGSHVMLPLSWLNMDTAMARLTGLSLTMVGLGLGVWALITMLHARKATDAKADQVVLVTSGPFACLRNPMYVGYALILLGLVGTTQNIWIAIFLPVFIVLVTWLAILPEERHLEGHFAGTYRDYKKRTRRWI